GIRDKLVTGVQTCALPIFRPPCPVRLESLTTSTVRFVAGAPPIRPADAAARASGARPRPHVDGRPPDLPGAARLLGIRSAGWARSEERRVGEESVDRGGVE